MATRKELALGHSFIKGLIFRFKTYVFIIKRYFQNKTNMISRFKDSSHLLSESVISVSESELWNKDDNAENWIMTAGKIQNLRIAASLINGTEIPAGEIFSFWKYVGKPSHRNGYVVGREIREGCIVPSIAGGLCQLSNALYDAAIKANFRILERHKHSQVVKGSLAEQDRDATVKWNYIDLRFVSEEAFRIEIEMDSERLFVKLKSKLRSKPLSNLRYVPQIAPSPLNDCYSCWNTDCYICNTKDKIANTGVVTYILDERWSEYEEYINKNIKDQDFVLQPFSDSLAKILKRDRLQYSINKGRKLHCNIASIYRLISFHLNKGKNVFSWQLMEDEKLIKAMIQKIPIESTHLVVSQNLLPFLYKYYAFAGRTYDVLMVRSSIRCLQADLDIAQSRYPNSSTLSDFRAPEVIMNLEDKALGKAAKVITPHSKVAKEFDRAECLDWKIQPRISTSAEGKKILFPASLLARKGAYEMRQLVKDIGFELVVHGKAIESSDFMKGVCYEQTNGNMFQDVSLVVLPAYAEHHPVLILKAIEMGIPVIVSEACGIKSSKNVVVVPVGDYDKLKEEVIKAFRLFNL